MFTVKLTNNETIEIVFFVLHGEAEQFELFTSRDECIVKPESEVVSIRENSSGTYFYINR